MAQDYDQAAALYRKSAINGFAQAQSNLGFMYEKGQGVAQNYELAYMLFSIAVNNGFNQAVGYRNTIAKTMTAAQISEAQKLASSWKVGTPLSTTP